jgi:hypothetical protein
VARLDCFTSVTHSSKRTDTLGYGLSPSPSPQPAQTIVYGRSRKRHSGLEKENTTEARSTIDPRQLRVEQRLRIPGRDPSPPKNSAQPEGKQAGGSGSWDSLKKAFGVAGKEKKKAPTASSWVSRPGDPYQYRRGPDGSVQARRGAKGSVTTIDPSVLDASLRKRDGEWVRVERGADDNRARRPSFGTMLQAAIGLETDRRIVGGQ